MKHTFTDEQYSEIAMAFKARRSELFAKWLNSSSNQEYWAGRIMECNDAQLSLRVMVE